MDWVVAIIRYRKKLKKIRDWAFRNGDPEMRRALAEDLHWWKTALKKELRKQ